MIATTLFSNSHIYMTVAAIVVLALIIVRRLTTKYSSGKRNLITGALLVSIVTTVGIGIYPILFKKKADQSAEKKGDIEKTGGTIFICKITPMRDENGENIAISPSSVQRAIKTIEKRLGALNLKGSNVEAQGSDEIRIVLPGIFEEAAPQIRQTLAKLARLELKQVHPDSHSPVAKVAAYPENKFTPSYKLYVLKNEDEDGQSLVILEERTVSAELALMSAQKP